MSTKKILAVWGQEDSECKRHKWELDVDYPEYYWYSCTNCVSKGYKDKAIKKELR
jgi:hypothetical protein